MEGAEDLRWSLKLRATEQDGFVPGQRREKSPRPHPLEVRPGPPSALEFGILYIYEWRVAEGCDAQPGPPDS